MTMTMPARRLLGCLVAVALAASPMFARADERTDDRGGEDQADLQAFTASDVYDQGLMVAVQRFQARHGLETTGWINAETADELNVPVQWRIAQLARNLDRSRRVPRELGLRYMHINIPDAHL